MGTPPVLGSRGLDRRALLEAGVPVPPDRSNSNLAACRVVAGGSGKFQIKNRPHGTVGGKLLTIARAGERRARKEGEFRGGFGGVRHHEVVYSKRTSMCFFAHN